MKPCEIFHSVRTTSLLPLLKGNKRHLNTVLRPRKSKVTTRSYYLPRIILKPKKTVFPVVDSFQPECKQNKPFLMIYQHTEPCHKKQKARLHTVLYHSLYCFSDELPHTDFSLILNQTSPSRYSLILTIPQCL